MFNTSRQPRSWAVRIAAGVLLATAVVAVGSPAAASTSANLILNPGAETGQCSPGGWDETTVPGWTITSGDPVIDCYNASNSANTATPGAQGTGYFQGGSRGSSEMTQTVNVSSAASTIDSGAVSATLSGYLGGVSSFSDATTVTATYLTATGTSIGSTSIGPVTPGQRANTTELLSKTTTATVPTNTRSITIKVDFAMTGTQNDALADGLSLTLTTAVTTPTLTMPASNVPAFDHVFVVMMENNSYSSTSNTVAGGPGIIGNTSGAPYINNTLVPMGSLLTNYHAITHNSDPNYEAIAFGNAYGRSANSSPGANCITNPACAATNAGINDNLDAIGKSWKEYVQSQTSNCQTTTSGEYENDDVPFYYDPKMQSNNAYCQAHWQPLPQLLNTDLTSTATTPAFVWADADSCDDMEDCGITAGDTWLSQTLPHIFNSPAWTTQRSLLILTWDEDGNNGGTGGFGPGQTNQVATIAIGSQGTVKAGFQDSSRYDHYSTARVIDGALGLPTMTGDDAWASPYNDAFTGAAGANTVTVTNPGTRTGTVGTAASLQLTGSDSASGQTLTWSATGLPAGLSISASGLISGTPTTAGASTVTAKANDTTSAFGTTTFTWTISGSGNQYTVPIVNGDAETGTCSQTGGGSGGYNAVSWTLTNTPQEICYGSSGGYPAASSPGPTNRGTAFFDGGPSASSSMTQSVSVAADSSQIVTGTLPYHLSGWLGGYSSQNDQASVTATFLNSAGTSLGTAMLGPVTATQRSNTTELLQQTATGTVPVGTITVKFTVTFTRHSGTDCDGYVDDITMTFGS